MPRHSCDLEQALGRTVPCPGADCVFWDDGCVATGLRADLHDRTELARLLLSLKDRLEALRPSHEHALLPPGLRD
jgi:hypothetical protein